MDHSCYRCGKSVEEGKPFCPECRAPLIRVAVAEAPPVSPLPELDVSREISPGSPLSAPTPQTRIDWAHAWPAVMLAGVIGAALMIFPFGALGLGMITAGALAVVFYHRRAPYSRPSSWVGVQLGALTGVIGFGIFTVFLAVVSLLSGTDKIRRILLEAISTQAAAKAADPQTQQIFEYFKSPPGLAVLLVFCLFFMFLMSVVFALAGGAMASAWIRRRERL